MSAQTSQRSSRQDLVWGCSWPDFVPTPSGGSRKKRDVRKNIRHVANPRNLSDAICTPCMGLPACGIFALAATHSTTFCDLALECEHVIQIPIVFLRPTHEHLCAYRLIG